MAVRIKLATTAAERDALFRVRHRVYVEQCGYLPPRPDQRIYDRFDAFPDTTNVIAVADGQVIGGVRLAEPSAAGTPADEYFDFGPFLPPDATRVGSASMLCLDHAHRHRKRLVSCMASVFYCLARQRRLSHILAPCNPEIEPQMFATGYRRVAAVFRHPSGLAVSPLLLDLDDVPHRLSHSISVHDHELAMHSLERALFCEGETVISAGEPGDAAYVVLQGVAVIEARGVEGRRRCGSLGPGDMFGELSLLTGRPHHASVTAATDLDLMVLDGTTFRCLAGVAACACYAWFD